MNLRRIKRWFKRRWVKSRNWRTIVFTSIVLGFIHLYLLSPLVIPMSGLGSIFIEPKLIDFWFMLRGRIDPPKEVLVVAVDEESHEKLGASRREVWPRRLTAQLLETIAPYKPKAVLLDYLYSSESTPEEDARLAEALSLSPTYIGKVLKPVQRVDENGYLKRFDQWLLPQKIFQDKAAGYFFGNLPVLSGIVRNFKTGVGTENNITPIAEILWGEDAINHRLPSPRDYINFYGPPGSVPTIPFFEVLRASPENLERMIKDRYILVGQLLFLAYSAKQTDTFITPFQLPTAGVEVHATVTGNLLQQNWLKRVPLKLERIGAIVIAGSIAYLLLAINPFIGGFVLIGLIIGWSTFSYIMFLNNWYVPGAILMLGIWPIAYAISCIRYYIKSKELEKAVGLS